jgi:hypothetical protein
MKYRLVEDFAIAQERRRDTQHEKTEESLLREIEKDAIKGYLICFQTVAHPPPLYEKKRPAFLRWTSSGRPRLMFCAPYHDGAVPQQAEVFAYGTQARRRTYNTLGCGVFVGKPVHLGYTQNMSSIHRTASFLSLLK